MSRLSYKIISFIFHTQIKEKDKNIKFYLKFNSILWKEFVDAHDDLAKIRVGTLLQEKT